MNRRFPVAAVALLAAACDRHPSTPLPSPSASAGSGTAPVGTASPPAGGAARRDVDPVPLPGAGSPSFLDYIVYEPAASRVWVPIGDKGIVGVFDVAGRTFARVDGFATAEREVRGKKRVIGPTAVTIGEGFAYVGNRATAEVCAVDVKTLRLGGCLKLPAPIDGVTYAASVKEVWVTMPHDGSLAVLDASKPDKLASKTIVKVSGEPEGYGVDDAKGLFFTNLEDKGSTLAIDLRTHQVKSTWTPACGADGPRGLAVDPAHGFVVVACTDHLQVLDAAHDGAPLGKLDTGAGVDNIDYLDSKRWVVAAAAKAARVTFARLDDKGQLIALGARETAQGARNAVFDATGNAYVADGQGSRLLVARAPTPETSP